MDRSTASLVEKFKETHSERIINGMYVELTKKEMDILKTSAEENDFLKKCIYYHQQYGKITVNMAVYAFEYINKYKKLTKAELNSIINQIVACIKPEKESNDHVSGVVKDKKFWELYDKIKYSNYASMVKVNKKPVNKYRSMYVVNILRNPTK